MNHTAGSGKPVIAHLLDEWADATAMSALALSDWISVIRAVRTGCAMLNDNRWSTARRIRRGFVQG
jgi:hypothetical protein